MLRISRARAPLSTLFLPSFFLWLFSGRRAFECPPVAQSARHLAIFRDPRKSVRRRGAAEAGERIAAQTSTYREGLHSSSGLMESSVEKVSVSNMSVPVSASLRSALVTWTLG
jgi:hypothetical protein